MPQTQTIELFAPPGQTLIAKLFAPASDTEIASVTATEATNRKGVYQAVYTDVPAATYRVLALVGTVPVASWWVDLSLTTATFQSYEIPTSVTVAGVYNALPSGGWVNGGFGDRLLVSASAQRTVSVTLSNHIAADIHELQPGVISATHFDVDYQAFIRSILGLSANNLDAQLSAIPAYGDAQRWTSPANQIDVTITQV
jgi:hypothetical protein